MLKYLMFVRPFPCVFTLSIKRSLALYIEMRKQDDYICISILYKKKIKNSVIRHQHEQNSLKSQLILLITNVFES